MAADVNLPAKLRKSGRGFRQNLGSISLRNSAWCASLSKSLARQGEERFAPPAFQNIFIFVKPNPAYLALIAPAFALFSCATPKASVVQEPSAAPQVEKPTTSVASVKLPPAERTTPVTQDDDIRVPDMLGMPGEDEFRTNRTKGAGSADPSPVIVRPPTN